MGTDSKKKHKQKVTEEKEETQVMEDKAKKILEKHALFAKQLLWHLHLALSAVCALQETQAAFAHTKLQLCLHRVRLKGLCLGPKFCLAFTAFSISKYK